VNAFGVGDGTAENGTTIAAGSGVALPDGVLPPEAFTIGGSLSAANNDTVVTGPVVLAGQAAVSADFGSLTFNGVISGAGALTVNLGKIVLANTNTYTGGTTITDFGSPMNEVVLAATNALPPSTMLNLPQQSPLTIRRVQQTLARLDGFGTVKFESTANPGERAALILAPAAPIGVFSGTLVGDGDLRHAGPGTHTLTLAAAGLTGTAAIDQGLVNLEGTLPVELSVGNDGELSLANANVGSLTVAGRLNLASLGGVASSLTLADGELWSGGTVGGPATPGRINVSGPVSLGDSSLSIHIGASRRSSIFAPASRRSCGPTTSPRVRASRSIWARTRNSSIARSA
jgi:hypothetical protein